MRRPAAVAITVIGGGVLLAVGVELGKPAPEEGEEVSIVRMPFAEAVARARTGGFAEGQTALTILLAAARLCPPDDTAQL